MEFEFKKYIIFKKYSIAIYMQDNNYCGFFNTEKQLPA